MTGTIANWILKKCHIDISLNEVEMELILWAEMFHHQQEPQPQPV